MPLPISLPPTAVVLRYLGTSTSDPHGEVRCFLSWNDQSGEIHEEEIQFYQMAALSKYLVDEGLELPLSLPV